MGRYSVNVSLRDYEKAAGRKKGIDSLYDELDELRTEFESGGGANSLPEFDMPDKIELDRIEFERKTAEELKKQAAAESEGKYDGALENLEREAERKEAEYAERQAQAEKDAAKQSGKIDELYDSQKQSAENQAVRRGLARSSVIMNMLAENDRGRVSDKLAVDEKSREEIQNIQHNIDKLAGDLAAAKNTYNDKLAGEIEKRMLALLDEQEDKYLAAVKHNNDATQKEADYKREREQALANRAKTVSELNRNEALYGSELGKKKYLEKKFETVRNYLDGLDKKEALQILESDKTVKDALGSYYRLMRRYLESK